MKKISFSILLSILYLTSTAQQKEDHVIGAQIGFSSTGFLFNTAVNSSLLKTSVGLNLKGGSTLPAFSITYDYHLSDNISIGGLFSIQHLEAQLDDIEINTTYFDTTINPITANFNRLYIGIVPRYHYTTEDDKLDLYSAARIGFIFWNTNLESDQIAAINEFSAMGAGRPAIALIPLGGRYYMTEHFAFNFELSVGAPYLFNIGLNYKL
jgi:hypothetical protein